MKIVIELSGPEGTYNPEQMKSHHTLSFRPSEYTDVDVLYVLGTVLDDMEVSWSDISCIVERDCEGNW